jgi:hypothetical protein
MTTQELQENGKELAGKITQEVLPTQRRVNVEVAKTQQQLPSLQPGAHRERLLLLHHNLSNQNR